LTTAVVGRLETTPLEGVFLVMTCVTGGAVEVTKLLSPAAKAAVMTSDGTTSELVVQLAVWVVVLRDTPVHPAMATPFAVKLTVSVAAVAIGENPVPDANVAVKVTDASTVDATVGEIVSVVAAGFTVWVSVAAVEVKKLASLTGLKVATMESDGAASELVVQLAVWVVVLRDTPVHPAMATPFAVKLTVSVAAVVIGVNAVPDANVAVKVTDASTVDATVGEIVSVVAAGFMVSVPVPEAAL
jgi:hypothetical protein